MKQGKELNNRADMIQAAIDLLREFDYKIEANKLEKAHKSTKRRLELTCGNKNDRHIADALQACGLAHVYLTDTGVMYYIK